MLSPWWSRRRGFEEGSYYSSCTWLASSQDFHACIIDSFESICKLLSTVAVISIPRSFNIARRSASRGLSSFARGNRYYICPLYPSIGIRIDRNSRQFSAALAGLQADSRFPRSCNREKPDHWFKVCARNRPWSLLAARTNLQQRCEKRGKTKKETARWHRVPAGYRSMCVFYSLCSRLVSLHVVANNRYKWAYKWVLPACPFNSTSEGNRALVRVHHTVRAWAIKRAS